MSHNTICYYMRNLKSVWRQAVDDGCVPAGVHPFEHVRSKPRKTVKRALDRLSLRRIHDAEFPANSRLEFARDLFLFSFFSRGMPFVDIIYLKKSSVGNGVISYRRRKTGQWLHVSLTPQLKALIRKYANESEYVFPVLQGTDGRDLHRQYRLALERVNRYLKRIALECGVSVPLTTYVARHQLGHAGPGVGSPGRGDQRGPRPHVGEDDADLPQGVRPADRGPRQCRRVETLRRSGRPGAGRGYSIGFASASQPVSVET